VKAGYRDFGAILRGRADHFRLLASRERQLWKRGSTPTSNRDFWVHRPVRCSLGPGRRRLMFCSKLWLLAAKGRQSRLGWDETGRVPRKPIGLAFSTGAGFFGNSKLEMRARIKTPKRSRATEEERGGEKGYPDPEPARVGRCTSVPRLRFECSVSGGLRFVRFEQAREKGSRSKWVASVILVRRWCREASRRD
jgi:hypothetical protein